MNLYGTNDVIDDDDMFQGRRNRGGGGGRSRRHVPLPFSKACAGYMFASPIVLTNFSEKHLKFEHGSRKCVQSNKRLRTTNTCLCANLHLTFRPTPPPLCFINHLYSIRKVGNLVEPRCFPFKMSVVKY
jgi:hypothetical protein